MLEVAPTGEKGARKPPLVVVVNRVFPTLTTTFHYREYRELAKSQSFAVQSWAFKRPDAPPAEAEDVSAETHYLPPLFSLKSALAFLGMFLRRPLRTLRALLGVTLMAQPGNKEGGVLGAFVFGLQGAQLAYALRAAPPAVFFSQFSTEGATGASVAARILGVRFVLAVHSPFTLYRGDALLVYKARQACLARAISDYARGRLIGLAGEETAGKIEVVHCGVDTNAITPARTDPGETPLVLCVGSLFEMKGQRYLIEACSRLRRMGARFRCEIVGQGPLREELARLIAAYGLGDTVLLRGPLPSSTVMRMYGGTAIFVLPCCVMRQGIRDGVPVALMEAMAAGVPCVSTRVAGIPELISSPDEGILVAERNPEQLAEAMRQLLDDPPRRERIGRAARAKVEREFDLARNGERLRGFISRALEIPISKGL